MVVPSPYKRPTSPRVKKLSPPVRVEETYFMVVSEPVGVNLLDKNGGLLLRRSKHTLVC